MDKLVELGLGGEVGPAGYCRGEGALPARASQAVDYRWWRETGVGGDKNSGFLQRPLLGLQDGSKESSLGPSRSPKRWYALPA